LIFKKKGDKEMDRKKYKVIERNDYLIYKKCDFVTTNGGECKEHVDRPIIMNSAQYFPGFLKGKLYCGVHIARIKNVLRNIGNDLEEVE
jgi:hypothetical protein